MASGFIYPTTVYGAISEVYGSAVPAYANTPGGFPQGSGLQLGMFGVLFDGTMCRLLKSMGVINPFDAVTIQTGDSNDYQVLQTSAIQQYIIGANDRSGSTPLGANNIAWFTTRGNAIMNVLPSLAGDSPVVSNTQPGYAGAYSPGVANLGTGVITGYSTQTNIILENSTTVQGAYPVRIG